MAKEKICVCCNKPFSDRGNNAIYCSESCSRRSTVNKAKAAKRAAGINKVAHIIYQAYDCKCALCGWQATNELIILNGKAHYSKGNEIHHITPLSKGGEDSLDNLILLCPNHHKQADMGLIPKDTLIKHLKKYDSSEENWKSIKSECADTIAGLIF